MELQASVKAVIEPVKYVVPSMTPEQEALYTDICVHGEWKMHIYDLEVLDKAAREINAKTIVEIGSMSGTSTQLLGRVARDNGGHMYCFDPRPKDSWFTNMKRLSLEPYVTMTIGYSPWAHSKVNIPAPIDFLMIDGEHKLRWCLTDYHYWEHYVRRGGRIAFHDIYGPPSKGVNRALDIIMEDEKTRLREIARVSPIHAKRRGGILVFEKLV
jgi:predicted O-methyltransferase YrrM